jgi:hypothetical protein
LPTGAPLNPFAALLFMEAARGLNKRASAKRARWAAHIGRPFRLSLSDPRPDPGVYDNEPGLIDG